MHLQISSAKRWKFCPGGDELGAESGDFMQNYETQVR